MLLSFFEVKNRFACVCHFVPSNFVRYHRRKLWHLTLDPNELTLGQTNRPERRDVCSDWHTYPYRWHLILSSV
jgi:hypothetical protein